MTGRRAAVLILAPAAPFLVLALATTLGWLPDPFIALHGDIAAVALTVAGLLAGHVAFLLWRAGAHRRRVHRAVAATQDTAAQERTRFLRRIHHELKNPLAAALDELAELRTTTLDPTQQQSAAAVESHCQRANTLITELRQLTDLRVRPLEREVVDMKELAHMVVDFVHDEGSVHPFVAGGGQVRCECPVSGDLPAVSGDPVLLSTALYNVVGNACKFTPPQGQVTVRVEQEGPRWIQVQVIDTGRGIPDKDQADVGQELFRARNVGDVPGRGLGLAMARTIAEQHGGSLAVQSGEGRGTIVTVRLPAGRKEAR